MIVRFPAFLLVVVVCSAPPSVGRKVVVMSRSNRSLLGCLCLAACWVPFEAVSLESSAPNDFLLDTNHWNNTVSIVGYTGTAPNVVIPAQIAGRDVYAIGGAAFAMLTHITRVEMPDTIEVIFEDAFCECVNLQSVTFGAGLQSLLEGAFEGCDIRELTLPDGLAFVGARAFAGNANLHHFNTGHGLTHAPRSAIETAALETVEIGNGITEIGGFDNWARPGTGPLTFAGASNLWRAVLGTSISNIGYRAFADCVSLEEVNIPASVQVIGSEAFLNTGIRHVDIGEAVTDIGTWAFQNTRALTSVSFGESLATIGTGAFAGSSITNAPLTGAIGSIGNEAFSGATGLVHVAIGASVSNIGARAFQRTTTLESFQVHPDNLHYKEEDGFLLSKDGSFLLQAPLGSGAISNTIPGTVQTIANSAFMSHPTLEAVSIPGNVKVISDWAFPMAPALRQLELAEGIEEIGSYAFAWTGVQEVNVPASVVLIALQAFYRTFACSNINVNAANPMYSSPGGVLFNKDQTVLIQYPPGRAGDYAIPDNTTSIGNRAFAGANYLTGVSIPGTVTEIEENAFHDCKNLTAVVISNGVNQVGRRAFLGCSNLTSITMPASVTSLVSQAFEGCTSLQSVFFQGDAPTLAGSTFFAQTPNVTVYRRAETTGWPDAGETWAGAPTAVGLPPLAARTMRADAAGISFDLGWANTADFVVEAATDLMAPVWVELQRNSGVVKSNRFVDGQAGVYSQRVYRVRQVD